MSNQSRGFVHLPLGGDVWRPYEFDAEGNIVQRPDSIDTSKMPQTPPAASADVQAILMAELDKARAELNQQSK